ncbi:MAG: filamentous hemagglutinin N-terminal domain-containing protein, partial [Campylobacteraceae bacterium]|nr:filamentous hemagglutinin N-terminal domain-containing protein [Campylobacteraceae bacterium]
GNERSIINGALNANGQVWLLNSNGILFGKNARVNTAGILATTKNLSDDDFNSGNYIFKGNSHESVINLGEIDITDSGYAALLASNVSNEGTIKAVRGKVHLVGAEEVSISLNGNSLVELIVKKGVLDAIVENKGAVYTKGGEIYLTTNAVDELLKGVVNNTGIVEAQSFDDIAGKIELFAHGGEVQVGGNLKAEGGFIETSGKEFTFKNANIQAGEWLIDPVNVTIDSSLATAIETALGSGDVTITTDASNTPDTSSGESGTDGDITINSDITWNTNKLTLTAANDINVYATLDLSGGTGTLAMNYDSTNGNVRYGVWNETAFRGKVNYGTRTGTGLLSVNSNDYNIINSTTTPGVIYGAQYYAIGQDIDFSSNPITSNWIFKVYDGGILDGLGNTLDNIEVTTTYAYQGFIKDNYGTVKNIGVSNFKVITNSNQTLGFISRNYSTGNIFGIKFSGTTDFSGSATSITGALSGQNSGAISEVSQTGIMELEGSTVGGLVGYNKDAGTINNIYSDGTLNITQSYNNGTVGGFIASAYGTSTVDNAVFDGTFNYSASSADTTHGGSPGTGGIIGYNRATVKNSTFSGTINSNTLKHINIGGIAGQNEGLIDNANVTGTINIKADNSYNIGGI